MIRSVAVVSEVAAAIGLLPLVWLSGLRARDRAPEARWWWLAAAFGISWLADTAAVLVDPWLVSAVYPVSQATLIGVVLLERKDALRLLVVLGVVGVVGVFWEGITGPGVLLRTVAWGAVVGLAWTYTSGPLRTALLLYFGLGLLAWWGFTIIQKWPDWEMHSALFGTRTISPAWVGWGAWQGDRLLALMLFCWAASHPTPHRQLLRST